MCVCGHLNRDWLYSCSSRRPSIRLDILERRMPELVAASREHKLKPREPTKGEGMADGTRTRLLAERPVVDQGADHEQGSNAHVQAGPPVAFRIMALQGAYKVSGFSGNGGMEARSVNNACKGVRYPTVQKCSPWLHRGPTVHAKQAKQSAKEKVSHLSSA